MCHEKYLVETMRLIAASRTVVSKTYIPWTSATTTLSLRRSLSSFLADNMTDYTSALVLANGPDGFCFNNALDQNLVSEEITPAGLLLYYIPFDWCMKNCPGYYRFSQDDIFLLLFQFILPVIIFSLIVPRRWHIDIPDRWFLFEHGFLVTVFQGLFSAIAVSVAASADMLIWITVIMTFAGPMLVSGIQEALLDFRITRAIGGSQAQWPNHVLGTPERLELLVVALCGNFELVHGNARQLIYDNFIHTGVQLDILKSRLGSILNSQPSFGASVGVPGLFFLGGFLYNALGINDITALGRNWTPFAVWWMVLIYVAVISATLLAGNNPSSVSVLIANGQASNSQTMCLFIKDYYESELHPVSMWDRGSTKRMWLESSNVWRQHPWFQEEARLKSRHWFLIALLSMVLVLFPSLMAYAMAYYLPSPRFGCRTLAYSLYGVSQGLLILFTLWRNYLSLSLSEILRLKPWDNTLTATGKYAPFQISSANVILRTIWWIFVVTLSPLATILSFLVTLPGSIFQIFSLYNNCVCQNAVSTWAWPSYLRYTYISHGDPPEEYRAYLTHLAKSTTWSTAIVTGILCFSGWWYQRALRTAVAKKIKDLR